MNQLPAIVVEELDVSVLLRRDGDGQRGVAEHLVDLAGGAWSAGTRPATISAVGGSESFLFQERETLQSLTCRCQQRVAFILRGVILTSLNC